MRLLVCAVFDKAVEAYTQPFFVRSKAEAIRQFTDAVNKDGSPMSVHYRDFSLYELGSYDDNAGSFDCLKETVRIVTGHDVIVKDDVFTQAAEPAEVRAHRRPM